MNHLTAGLCILALVCLANCDRMEGEIDLKEEKGFHATKYPKEYFLTPLPSSTIRSISYHVRTPNPFSINPIPNARPDTAYTKAYLHQSNSNKTKGFVQFRQVSDMWLTEIKGVVESLEPNSSYLLVIHQNQVAAKDGNLCFDLGPPFHYAPVSEATLNNVRARHALGDLGVFTSDRNGIGAVNLNAIYTSLFGGPGTISGRSLAVYKLKGEEVILKPVHCGMIKLPTYAPAHFQSDPNTLQVKKVKSGSSYVSVSTSTTTKEPTDFDKPPNA